MKIYLFHTKDGRRLFYAAPQGHDSAPHPVRHTGLRGWLERKSHEWRTAWHNAQHGLSGWLHRLWERLQLMTYADESLLVRLRSAQNVEIHHPPSFTNEEVQALWSDYLANRQRRHLPWLGINALVSPLTLLLAVLPGPNMIGYWFAYRAIRHLMALLGIRRARRDFVPVSAYPTSELEHPIDHKGQVLQLLLSQGHDKNDLHDFLTRSDVVHEPSTDEVDAHS